MVDTDPELNRATEIEAAWQLRESAPKTALDMITGMQHLAAPGSLDNAKMLIVEAACMWRNFDFTSMMDRLVKAFDILQYKKDYLWIARLQGRISVGLTSAGDMAGAYKHLHLQLSAAARCQGGPHRDAELFTVFHNMGRHFFVREDYKRADQCYQRCYRFLSETDATNVLLKQNHAETIARLGKLSEAASELEAALKLAEQHPPNRSVVYALGVKSWVLIEQNEPDLAEETLFTAIEYATKHEIPSAQLRMKLASLHLSQQRLDKALEDLQPVEEIIKKRGDQHDKANYHHLMSRVFEAKDFYRAALVHLKKYHHEQQSIHTNATHSRVQADTLIDKLEAIRRESVKLKRENLVLRDTVSRYKSLHSEALELSERDSLTGLYNRRMLEKVADDIIGLTAATLSTVAVAIIDLDHFKHINDTYGHHIGDLVLQKFAGLLSDTFRAADCIARYGGEEFVLIIPQADHENARDALHRLRTLTNEYPWSQHAQGMTVTFSAGIASTMQSEKFDSLFQKADSALYLAKAMGRDRICIEGSAIDFTDANIVPDIDLSKINKVGV
jgi:diguanylate cyclase (GGDEF)-like protein